MNLYRFRLRGRFRAKSSIRACRQSEQTSGGARRRTDARAETHAAAGAPEPGGNSCDSLDRDCSRHARRSRYRSYGNDSRDHCPAGHRHCRRSSRDRRCDRHPADVERHHYHQLNRDRHCGRRRADVERRRCRQSTRGLRYGRRRAGCHSGHTGAGHMGRRRAGRDPTGDNCCNCCWCGSSCFE